jgi:hypothetical protein
MAQPMPEEQGIATLPAPNMQNMAEGGIVAFEGGGEVPRYYDGVFVGQGFNQTPLISPPTQNRNALIAEKAADISAQAKQDELRKIEEALLTAPPGQQRAFLENRKNILSGKNLGTPTPAVVPTAASAPQFTPGGVGKRMAPPPPPPPPAQDKSPLAALVQKPASADAAKSAAVLPTLNTTSISAEEAARQAAAFGDDKAMRAELQGYVDRQKKIGEDAVGSFQQGIAGLPEAYKKYEARLQKEEAEADTDKNKAIGMSIFKAGLAMMAGTSQNAFENIGKGAMVGLEDQQAALKDFKKAQRERDRAFADIEAARLADQRGDLKTKLELENRAADRNSNAEGRMVEGISKLFDTNKTNARGIYQTGVEQVNQNQRSMFEQGAATERTMIQERGANARTQAQLSAPPAEARMAMMLGTGKTQAERLESGLAKIQALQSDKTGATYAKLYADHVTDARKQMTEPMTPTEFAASMRGVLAAMSPRVVTAPGANAPVYDRPK